MEQLRRIAAIWQTVKADLVGGPAVRDGLHVVVGLVLFLLLRRLFRRTRFPSALAAGTVAALQILNEVLDGGARLRTTNLGEAVSDTALTLVPVLLLWTGLHLWHRRNGQRN